MPHQCPTVPPCANRRKAAEPIRAERHFPESLSRRDRAGAGGRPAAYGASRDAAGDDRGRLLFLLGSRVVQMPMRGEKVLAETSLAHCRAVLDSMGYCAARHKVGQTLGRTSPDTAGAVRMRRDSGVGCTRGPRPGTGRLLREMALMSWATDPRTLRPRRHPRVRGRVAGPGPPSRLKAAKRRVKVQYPPPTGIGRIDFG